jgi:hypothetical protein
MAKEKMMRYVLLIAAIVLAACTVPPMEQKQETKPVPVSPTIEITAPREAPDAPKAKEHKPKVTPAPAAPSAHPCAGIETGDAKSDVKAKLECLEEHA